MTKPSVKIKIEAEDEASAKLAQAAANTEKAAARIKSTTGTTKQTSEFIGSFASALGGSEIGNAASQFGSLNEKIGQFAELSKAGGSGALAMKAGLAGVVAYASFNFGKMIGDAVFQTEKWKQELAFAKQELKEIGDKSLEVSKQRFADDFAEIKLIENPEQQKAEIDKLFTQAGNNAETYGKNLKSVQEKIKKLSNDNTFSGSLGSLFGEGDIGALGTIAQGTFWGGIEENIAELKEREAALKAMKDAEQDAIQAIQRFQGREKEDAAIAKAKEEQAKLAAEKEAAAAADDKAVETLRAQLAIEQAIGKEKFALQAAQMASSEDKRAEIAALLEEKDALSQQREAEKVAQQAREKELADQEKLVALRDSEMQKLKEREILLTQGAEAAQRFRLEQQGLAKADAETIAKEQARLDKLEADKTQKDKIAEASKGSQPLQAVESRFLRVAPGTGDPAKATAENTKRMSERLDRLIAIQEAAGNGENVDRLRKKQADLELIA